MGFWKDLGVLAQATTGAMKNAAEDLNEAAQQLEFESAKYLKRSQIKMFTRQFASLEAQKASSTELKVVFNQLLEAFDELEQMSDKAERLELSREKQVYTESFKSFLHSEKINNAKHRVEQTKATISNLEYHTPLSEKQDYVRYLSALKELKSLLSVDGAPVTELDKDILAASKKIEELERLRYQDHQTVYPDGQPESLVKTRDNKPFGKSEYWYPSGALKYSFDYKDGAQLHQANCYYESGEPHLKLDCVDSEGFQCYAYSAFGQEIWVLIFKNMRSSRFTASLWDGKLRVSGAFRKSAGGKIKISVPLIFWIKILFLQLKLYLVDRHQLQQQVDALNITRTAMIEMDAELERLLQQYA